MNKFEITSAKAKVEGENEIVECVLIHEIKDEFRDGDCILFNYTIDELTTDEEIEYAISNNYVESCFKYNEDENLYFVGSEA